MALALHHTPLVPIEATHPFQMVSIDYLKLDPCKNKYEYVLMVTDHYTRFCQMYGTKSKSSKAAADKLFNEFILQFGFPEKLHHDLGPEFNSKLFAELHRLTGIRPSNTTPYNPAGDGQMEQLNRTVINMLKSLPEKVKKDWRSHLPKLAFAYNSTVHKSTGYSPFYLLFGRQSTLPIDLAFQEVEVGQGVDRVTHKQFVEQWHHAMEEARKLASAKMGKAAEYNKRVYDKRAKAVELVVGDQVLMRNVRERGGTQKLKSFWEETLFKVIEKRANIPVYKIQSVKNSADIRQIHRNLLMKCNELPVDVFKEKEVAAKKQDSRKRKSLRKHPSKKQLKEPVDLPEKIASNGDDTQLRQRDLGESSDDDDMLAVHFAAPADYSEPPVTLEETAVQDEDEVILDEADIDGGADAEEVGGMEDLVVDNTSDAEVDTIEPDPDESVDADRSSNEQPRGEAETEATDSGDESSNCSSSDNDSPPRRVSTRTRTQTRIFTYDENGNPQWQDR